MDSGVPSSGVDGFPCCRWEEYAARGIDEAAFEAFWSGNEALDRRGGRATLRSVARHQEKCVRQRFSYSTCLFWPGRADDDAEGRPRGCASREGFLEACEAISDEAEKRFAGDVPVL